MTAYYEQAFGIIRPDDEAPQEVILSLTPTQGRYVQTYPLHASQQVLSKLLTATYVQLVAYDTYDLRMELLSTGSRNARPHCSARVDAGQLRKRRVALLNANFKRLAPCYLIGP